MWRNAIYVGYAKRPLQTWRNRKRISLLTTNQCVDIKPPTDQGVVCLGNHTAGRRCRSGRDSIGRPLVDQAMSYPTCLPFSLASFYRRTLKRHAWQFFSRTLTCCTKPKLHRAFELGEHKEVVGQFESKQLAKRTSASKLNFQRYRKQVA